MTPVRRRGRVFVVSSPSGGGKTTVVREVLEQLPNLTRSVSVTTRPRRSGERSGRDYRFVSPRVFERLRTDDQLLEWARVHQALYGTPRAPVERVVARGRDVICNIDVQGARQIKRRLGACVVLVFLLPPSLKDLQARLIRRGTDSREAIRRRLQTARRELACVQWYDYAIVNRRIGEAVAQLKTIVLAERLRVSS